MRYPFGQAWRAEHHAEVRPAVGAAFVGDTDRPAGRARASVAAEDIAGEEPVRGTVLVGGLDRDRFVRLVETGERPAGGQRDTRLACHGLPEHALDERLGNLLAGLGELVASVRRETEAVMEAGDLAAEERGDEHRIVRPRDGQRCNVAQQGRDAPAAEVLHRPHACRLRPRPIERDLDARLEHDDVDTSLPELERRRRARPDHHRRRAPKRRREVRHDRHPWFRRCA